MGGCSYQCVCACIIRATPPYIVIRDKQGLNGYILTVKQGCAIFKKYPEGVL